jgi:hypothetical protein
MSVLAFSEDVRDIVRSLSPRDQQVVYEVQDALGVCGSRSLDDVIRLVYDLGYTDGEQDAEEAS